LDISTQYLALRYQTDNVLINAENFGSYEKWNEEMTLIIGAWNKLENEAADLEKNPRLCRFKNSVSAGATPPMLTIAMRYPMFLIKLRQGKNRDAGQVFGR